LMAASANGDGTEEKPAQKKPEEEIEKQLNAMNEEELRAYAKKV
jgi:hypothetical protein